MISIKITIKKTRPVLCPCRIPVLVGHSLIQVLLGDFCIRQPLQFFWGLTGSETLKVVRRKLSTARKSSISDGPMGAQRESERKTVSTSKRLILSYQEEEVSWAAPKVFGKIMSVAICLSLKGRALWGPGVQAAPMTKIKPEFSHCCLESGRNLEILFQIKEHSRWKENGSILRTRKKLDAQGGKGDYWTLERASPSYTKCCPPG